MTRRNFLYSTAALLTPALKAQAPRSNMGMATTSYMTVRRYRDTYEFLEHCHTEGAAGIQSAITGDLPKIRARAEQYNMFIEAIIGLPRGEDTAGFEKTVQDAKAVGALCVRANAGGRRYEQFTTKAEYDDFAKRSNQAMTAAAAICEKAKMPLAIENHKDWTLDQMIAMMKSRSSEYFGACIDFGNNIALLDDPMELVQQLAPYAVTTHVKDMGVEPYPEGFLLSELPLGQGFLDLPKMFALVRKARPKTNFNLEMITRDPLKIPCLTDGYWATFPERKSKYLAPAMAMVKKRSGKPLPRISQLSHEDQLRVEEENVQICLRSPLAKSA